MTNPMEEQHINRSWVPTEDEPHFGKYPCDCCQSTWAGNRWDAVLMGWSVKRNRLEEINCGTICMDCLQDNT